MARRLAHEIKNPLTPIQLAVEECHGRYQGDDPGFRKLLDTTHDIVVEEVASLRHLVGEFAEFARLPRASLREGDVREFLIEQQERLLREAIPQHGDEPGVALDLSLHDAAMPAALDRTMFYRVLSNLVANGAQAALAEHGAAGARVRVSTSVSKTSCAIDVEDNGAGIAGHMRQTIFDPYVTTKKDGTGLGLTIVKKVVIDHGGQIEVDGSSLGGARFRIRLPLLGTPGSEAAILQSNAAPMSG
jgi:nitrogen fixation/metabolism regulation signal transduction histidine kinase